VCDYPLRRRAPQQTLIGPDSVSQFVGLPGSVRSGRTAGLIRDSPDSQTIARDFLSHRAGPQLNSIAAPTVPSHRVAGLPPLLTTDAVLLLHLREDYDRPGRQGLRSALAAPPHRSRRGGTERWCVAAEGLLFRRVLYRRA
jgi:hypothetical protein